MKIEIKTILDEFNKKFMWTDFSGDIGCCVLVKKDTDYDIEETARGELQAFLKQSLEKIAKQAVEMVMVEEKNTSPYKNRNERQIMWTDIGYNQAIKDIKDKANKLLK